jgi:hypothetical protein
MKTNILMLILILLLAFANKSQSQSTCPPNDDWGQSETALFLPFPGPSQELGQVNYQSRQIGGQTGNRFEIKVNWATMINKHYGGVTDEEFKRWMYYAIIRDICHEPCNFSGTREFAFYETTNCLVDKVCYWRVRQSGGVFCTDDDYPGPVPTFPLGTDGWRYFGRLTERVVCGTSCCEITYTAQCVGGSIDIINVSKSQVSGMECPEGNNERCIDGMHMPCTSTCN